MSDYFDGLESLLQESIAEKESRKALPKPPKPPAQKNPSRERRPKIVDPTKPANGSWMNSKEHEEYHRQVAIANAKGLWKTQAAVAMFATQVCLSCGSQHTHFEGFFFQQIHQSDRHTERWERARDMASLQNFPKFRKVTMHEADCCAKCASSHGYITPSPSQSEPNYAAWTPHQGNQKYSDQLEYSGGFGSTHKI